MKHHVSGTNTYFNIQLMQKLSAGKGLKLIKLNLRTSEALGFIILF